VLDEELHAAHSPRRSQLSAEALTQMRTRNAAEGHLRVAVGGKVTDWTGWLPGVPEELEASLLHGGNGKIPDQFDRPFVVLAQFGGAAGLVGRYLEDGVWPEAFDFDYAAENEARFRELLEHPDARASAHARFARLRKVLDAFRARCLEDGNLFVNAPKLTAARFREILRATSPTRAINLVARVAEELRP
jgi:hypothetical protein